MKAIVYVVDALRADHLSSYGYERATSPSIDKIARDGCRFERANAQATWTRASAAVILTGLYPPTNGLTQMDDRLPAGLPTLPQRLPTDVKTVCISAMGNVSSTFGFDRCFDDFIDLYKDDSRLGEMKRSEEKKMFQRVGDDAEVYNPTAEDINRVLFPWIERHNEEDFFVLVWSIDPHDPYEPLEQFSQWSADQEVDDTVTYQYLTRSESAESSKWILDRYDDLIRQNDAAIGDLVNFLHSLGIYEETCLTLTGDHGEAFGEHGVFGHATVPYEEVIHIPLIIKPPASVDHRSNVEGIVEHVDVLPTIVDLWDCDTGNFVQGESLFPFIRGEEEPEGSTFSHTNLRPTSPTFVSHGTQDQKYIRIEPPRLQDIAKSGSVLGGLRSWATYRRQFGLLGTQELLYVTGEHGLNEDHSLIHQNPKDTEAMRRAIERFFEDCASLKAQIQDDSRSELAEVIDDTTKEQLEHMGYL